MDFTTLQEELSEVIGESGTRTFTTAQRKRWLNEGVIEVCRRALPLKKKVTKNVVAATRTYHIVNDWSLTDFLAFAPEGIVYDGTVCGMPDRWDKLQRKTIEWLDENVNGWRDVTSDNQADPPEYYALESNLNVVFQPVPKTSGLAGWIIHYHYFPINGTTQGGLVDGADVPFDSVPWMIPYHRLPVLWAGYRALLKLESSKAAVVWQEFASGLQTLQRDLRRLPDYEPRLVVTSYRATR